MGTDGGVATVLATESTQSRMTDEVVGGTIVHVDLNGLGNLGVDK